MDSNHPEVVLAVTALVHAAAGRVRDEGLTVEPDEETRVFRVKGNKLLVPGFAYLGGDLLRAAATGGAEIPGVSAYLDSIFEFATPEDRRWDLIYGLKYPDDSYKVTEAEILASSPPMSPLPAEDGLRLVREACDKLEDQVFSLHPGSPYEPEREAKKT